MSSNALVVSCMRRIASFWREEGVKGGRNWDYNMDYWKNINDAMELLHNTMSHLCLQGATVQVFWSFKPGLCALLHYKIKHIQELLKKIKTFHQKCSMDMKRDKNPVSKNINDFDYLSLQHSNLCLNGFFSNHARFLGLALSLFKLGESTVQSKLQCHNSERNCSMFHECSILPPYDH